jgi:hypothetical protein
MIDDKMAKMAVNTLKKYCNTSFKTCNKRAVKDACCMPCRVFGNMDEINDVGTFESWRKPSERPPKFDIRQKDSADFQKYINEIFLREAEKYGLPMNKANSIKWFTNGKIKVTFVDDDATYVGVAKCHPDDAFNPEVGIKLAIERAAQVMHAPFVPEDGEAYYYVNGAIDDENLIYSTINHNSNKDALNIAVGNCFRKYKEAEANAAVIMKRIKKAAELLKKLRDEYRGEGMM